MNRKMAAVCIIAFVALASALYVAALNPAPSEPARASISGGAANSAGESVNFTVMASQEWQSSWGQGSWYVSGVLRTKTHYAHSIVMTSNNLQNGTAHWKIQFRGSKGSTPSVRWTSEQTNKYFGVNYGDSCDEQIDTLATALSFGTTNGSVSTASFSVYVEIWATGAITGQQLYAHTANWENFSSNQISYMYVVPTQQYTVAPTSFTVETGSFLSGTITSVATSDSDYLNVAAAASGHLCVVKYTFTSIPSNAFGFSATLQVHGAWKYGTPEAPYIYLYDYSTGWDLVQTWTDLTDEDVTHSAGLSSSLRQGDGSASIRVYLADNGADDWLTKGWYNYIALSYSAPTGSWFSTSPLDLGIYALITLAVIGIVWWRKTR